METKQTLLDTFIAPQENRFSVFEQFVGLGRKGLRKHSLILKFESVYVISQKQLSENSTKNGAWKLVLLPFFLYFERIFCKKESEQFFYADFDIF